MPRREGSEPLVRCLDLPCPWAATFRSCQHRIARRGMSGFPHALCAFYSTPGPHVPSKIARATGLTIDSVNKTLERVHARVREEVMTSRELRYDPTIQVLVEDHLEELSA